MCPQGSLLWTCQDKKMFYSKTGVCRISQLRIRVSIIFQFRIPACLHASRQASTPASIQADKRASKAASTSAGKQASNVREQLPSLLQIHSPILWKRIGCSAPHSNKWYINDECIIKWVTICRPQHLGNIRQWDQ